MILLRTVHTRFRFGSATVSLNLASHRNSPARSTKSTTSHLDVLCLLVSKRFQVLFHSPPGVLFTVPSRYYSLSVTWSYLALWDGPHFFRLDFSCPDVLRILPTLNQFRLRDFHPLSSTFPDKFGYQSQCLMQSLPLTYFYLRFGLLRFRSPLLSESFLLSFPPGTKMFQFPGFPSYDYGFIIRSCSITAWSSLIRISADQRIFAPPRSFSQLVTSFFGAMYLGILLLLFVA